MFRCGCHAPRVHFHEKQLPSNMTGDETEILSHGASRSGGRDARQPLVFLVSCHAFDECWFHAALNHGRSRRFT